MIQEPKWSAALVISVLSLIAAIGWFDVVRGRELAMLRNDVQWIVREMVLLRQDVETLKREQRRVWSP